MRRDAARRGGPGRRGARRRRTAGARGRRRRRRARLCRQRPGDRAAAPAAARSTPTVGAPCAGCVRASGRDHCHRAGRARTSRRCPTEGRCTPRNEDAVALAASDDRIGARRVRRRELRDRQRRRGARRGRCRARRARRAADPPAAESGGAGRRSGRRARSGGPAPRRSSAEAAAAKVGRGENPPSCTFVAAVVDGPVLVAGWVGDSRCYWFGDDGTAAPAVGRRLVGQRGRSPRARPARSPRQIRGPTRSPAGSASTRRPATPTCASVAGRGGRLGARVQRRALELLLGRAPSSAGSCTTRSRASATSRSRSASALCDWANEQGGHDNVTVALAAPRRPPRRPRKPPDPEEEHCNGRTGRPRSSRTSTSPPTPPTCTRS